MVDKLYVCMSDDGSISLNTRFDVDAAITNAEESDDSMPFSVVGNIKTDSKLTPFLFILKHDKDLLVYDVVEGTDQEDATKTVMSKKRNTKSGVEIKHVRDLSSILKSYYE